MKTSIFSPIFHGKVQMDCIVDKLILGLDMGNELNVFGNFQSTATW